MGCSTRYFLRPRRPSLKTYVRSTSRARDIQRSCLLASTSLLSVSTLVAVRFWFCFPLLFIAWTCLSVCNVLLRLKGTRRFDFPIWLDCVCCLLKLARKKLLSFGFGMLLAEGRSGTLGGGAYQHQYGLRSSCLHQYITSLALLLILFYFGWANAYLFSYWSHEFVLY
jgi:hypothetical protein